MEHKVEYVGNVPTGKQLRDTLVKLYAEQNHLIITPKEEKEDKESA